MAIPPAPTHPPGRPGFSPSAAAMHAGFEQFAALSSIFDAAEMVLYVADMQTYELLFMNSHARRLWGEKQIGGLCYKVLQSGQDQPCAFCTNDRLIENGEPAQPVVWEFQNTVNQHWYLCIDKAIPWSDGRLVRMEVAIDITERKQQEQFRQQYVGVISHDLRTPLATIALSASVLKELLDRAGLAEGAPAADRILRNTRRLADMVDDLVETTRLESGQLKLHPTSFDLGQLAETVAGQLAASEARQISTERRGRAVVLADAGRIERVLENLISNAFRYSPVDTQVQVCIEANQKEAIVTVADQGIGIAADELPGLFQRFYRAVGNTSAGLGLGLYNSRMIIERHGGRIWVDSSAGSGSVFGFALPLAPDTGAPTAP